MLRFYRLTILLVLAESIFLVGCGRKEKHNTVDTDDLKAKAMLEGVWVDPDEESVVFRVKGDTVYYPDSSSLPVRFRIENDTLVLLGNVVQRCPILRQESHLFEFKNQNGDIVKVVKSDNPADTLRFTARKQPEPVNQNTVIKSDTVIIYDGERYHSYIQVNPTTYKVFRTQMNDEGIGVENIYYDNTIHLGLYHGADKLFSKDFRKADFSSCVPSNQLSQCILSDIKLKNATHAGFTYIARLAIPDSPTSFLAEITVSYDGGVSIKVYE